MTTQHIETVIVGAGQAGLSVGYHLKKHDRPFIILDANERIGDNWREQWDTLRLFTPAKYNGLPGMRFPAEKWHFPQKDEVADFVESYALAWDLPVRMSTRVDRLEERPGGGYTLAIGADAITCDNVVIATGTFGRTPYVPEFAADLDPSILQMHSSEYRRPGQLQEGPVLVVGASHSGTDIAYELALTHPTILSGRDCGQIPGKHEGRGRRMAFPAMLFVARHVMTRRTPIGRKVMGEIRSHGGPMLRVQRADLRERGVDRRLPRVSGASAGRPVLEDDSVVDVTNIVWCTGFQQVFDWIGVPVIGEDGWPKEYRGVVDSAPGLYFCGLAFQFAFSSMVFPGVGRDAEFVARRIVERSGRKANLQAA